MFLTLIFSARALGAWSFEKPSFVPSLWDVPVDPSESLDKAWEIWLIEETIQSGRRLFSSKFTSVLLYFEAYYHSM